MPDTISTKEFFAAFLVAWEKKRGDTRVPVEEYFVDGGARWTSVVCGESVSDEVSQPLVKLAIDELRGRYPGLDYDRERHKVDAFARVPSQNVKGAPQSYLDYFNVAMIEVENSVTSSVEEFWKLLHSRIPLKILITYDYNEESNVGCMLNQFLSMHSASVAELGADTTCYLVIFGGRERFEKGAKIRWHGYELADGAFVPIAP